MTRIYCTMLIVALVLAVGACGDPTDCSGSASCEGGTPTGYPSGPYASNDDPVGKKLQDHTFTTTNEEALSFSDLRSAGDKTLLLLSTTAGWCTACIEEQPKLEGFYQQFGCKGLEVVVAMFEDLNFNPAQPIHASQWQQAHALSFPVVADPDNLLGTYYNKSAAPLNMIVDLCTMEVIYSAIGFDETAVKSLIEAHLD